MRVLTLIASTAIAFASLALAAPNTPMERGLQRLTKRTYPPTWYFPPYNGTFTPWEPVGCYSSDVQLTYNTGMCSCSNAAYTGAAAGMPFTMQKCFAYCKGAGFRYAGIKGNDGAKACNVPCDPSEGDDTTGYDASKCGGINAYSVWKDPCYGPYDLDSAVGGYSYAGCFYYYDGSILGYYIGTASDNLSIDGCVESCASMGYAYAGMAASEYSAYSISGDQCWCGGKIAQYWITNHLANPGDADKCNTLCSASAKVEASISKDDLQYCGGPWYMSIYYNPDLDSSQTCTPSNNTSSSSSSSAPPGTQKTTTITTPGPSSGTTTEFVTSGKSTITTSGTVTVIITTPTSGPADTGTQKTTTITTPGPSSGTTTEFVTSGKSTITTSGTVTVIITTPTSGPADTGTPEPSPSPSESSAPPGTQETTTITTPGPSSGTTTEFVTSGKSTITPSGTVTVIITTPTSGPADTETPEPSSAPPGTQDTTTITTPGPSSGTTTEFVTSGKSTITTSGTVTVIITTPTSAPAESSGPAPSSAPPGTQDTTTITTSGSKPGTTTEFVTSGKSTITTSGTVTVIVTTTPSGPSEKSVTLTTITETTSGDTPGTTTIPGPSTVTVIITTTGGSPAPTGPAPGKSCCLMPDVANNERRKGIQYPLGGFGPSQVLSTDKKSFTLVRLSGVNSNCRTSYKYTISEFQAACWNGCMEQQKKCYSSFAVKTTCTGSGRKKVCTTKEELKSQCDVQFKACKEINTGSGRTKNAFQAAMSSCGPPAPQSTTSAADDGGYYRVKY
ncbi:hypothetical protein AA313_de0203299 [Arthrobotrys entomopaga]|nr:hypothetical protein AA313_de0203299 [Arthrobotrys entomopaga]